MAPTTPMPEHLTTDELDLWAQGLLPAVRTMHLTECTLCLAEAQRERTLALTLNRLPRLAPTAGFADRVMQQVRIPTRSGDFQT